MKNKLIIVFIGLLSLSFSFGQKSTLTFFDENNSCVVDELTIEVSFLESEETIYLSLTDINKAVIFHDSYQLVRVNVLSERFKSQMFVIVLGEDEDVFLDKKEDAPYVVEY